MVEIYDTLMTVSNNSTEKIPQLHLVFHMPFSSLEWGLQNITGTHIDMWYTVVSPVSVRPQFPCTHSFV